MTPRTPPRSQAPKPRTSPKPRASSTPRVLPIAAAQPPLHPFDRLYATETGGLIPGDELHTGHPSDPEITAYYAIAPSILDALVDLWLQRTHPQFPIGQTAFLDVGAGKGRALMAASLHPFAETVGIEINPTLAALARRNLEAFTAAADPLAPPRLLEGDALEVSLPEGPTLAFLFHPFEAALLRRFLTRVEDHWASLPAPTGFDLIYVNAEHAEVLDRNPAFERLFRGMVPMSAEDHRADRAEIATQTEYGSTGDEFCAIYRLILP